MASSWEILWQHQGWGHQYLGEVKAMNLKEKIVFDLIQNIFVGFAITITVTIFTTGFKSVEAFVVAFVKAYVINFFACVIFPTDQMSVFTCNLLKSQVGSLSSKMINVAYCDICYVTFISINMFLLELGLCSRVLQA